MLQYQHICLPPHQAVSSLRFSNDPGSIMERGTFMKSPSYCFQGAYRPRAIPALRHLPELSVPSGATHECALREHCKAVTFMIAPRLFLRQYYTCVSPPVFRMPKITSEHFIKDPSDSTKHKPQRLALEVASQGLGQGDGGGSDLWRQESMESKIIL